MLQGLIADINKRSRASSILLPSTDDGWGTVLASTWMTGFPPRTGFGRGMPEFDPWRFDATRMIAAGEADLHLFITDKEPPAIRGKVKTVVLAPVAAPCRGAALTFSIGRPGIDHDTVRYSSLTGTLASVGPSAPSKAKSAAELIRDIAAKVPAEAALPC
jgi:formylmethanofuran dehydrogenase subunit B